MELTEMQKFKLRQIISLIAKYTDDFRGKSFDEIKGRITGNEIGWYYSRFVRLGMIEC